MTLLRTVLGMAGIVFAGLIVWAIMTGDFATEGRWLTSNPWGIVTLFDLYFGFVLSAIVIALFERSARAWFWILPIPFLGNVWVVIWFVVNLKNVAHRLRHP